MPTILLGYRATRSPGTVVKIEDVDGVIVDSYIPLNGAQFLAAREEYEAWLSAGNVLSPLSAQEQNRVAEETRERQDQLIARADPKLQALLTRDPTQIRAFIASNVNNLADAKDALTTLAVAISILARRL